MAFEDSPKVDLNAERSEESILRCKSFFSKRNGFISHSVDGTNDYGTDINCQIIEQGNVTPFQFPIQVKSKTTYKKLKHNNETFIASQFKTSRLSYLIKHTPTSGIIILFDENKNEIYYDFAFEIYNRIRMSHDDDLWKNQETITISIPKSNILDSSSINIIHDRCLRYYKNHDKLLFEHGKNYGLPILEDLKSNLTQSPLEIIEDIGELMFYYNKYPEIINILNQLDFKSLKRPKTAYVAAITYAEVGNIIEADYFLQVCEKHLESLSKKQIDTLKFQKFKFHFYSGILSRKELKHMLKTLGETLTDPDDIIYLKINLVNIDLMDSIGHEGIDDDIIHESERIFNEIENSNSNELAKHFQFLSVADILGKALNSKLASILIESRIIESIGGNKKTSSREILLHRMISLNDRCYKYLKNAEYYARKEDNKLLLAHSLLGISTLFFGKCFSFFMAKERFEKVIDTKAFLEDIYNSSLSAFNIFNSMELKTFAYTSITLASEIFLLSKYWADIDLNTNFNISEINNIIESFQQYDFKKKFKSVVEKVYQRHLELDSGFALKSRNGMLTEDEIEILAKSFVKHNGLPKKRLENIKKEIRAEQAFRLRCKNDDLLLKSEQQSFGKDAYILDNPKYAVFTKSGNLLIAEDYDINSLLRKLGY